ncbi:ribosomal protein S2, eukaryotic [Kipferlia bialata]|uniref:Small ribosomal subunit protein uS2 n=1 Tax=Kipferlia bialata TaxID=797122 RepID=A0A391NR69_9EUKA|nr:ribosomal protein S2, eukaryotic [Kipferlia bialata]|eukprot:g12532.t1
MVQEIAAQVPKCLALVDEDVERLLVAGTHIGTRNAEKKMGQYIYGRRGDGVHVFNVKSIWEKIVFAARVLATIENPADIAIVARRSFAQRAILKFAKYTGATAFTTRFTPGTFTNRNNPKFCEPRVLIVNDPRIDHQAIREATYANIPIIAFCNADSPIGNIDVVLPGNNKGEASIGLMYYLLCREYLRVRGKISRSDDWVMPDMFVHLDMSQIEKQEAEEAGETEPAAWGGAEDEGEELYEDDGDDWSNGEADLEAAPEF